MWVLLQAGELNQVVMVVSVHDEPVNIFLANVLLEELVLGGMVDLVSEPVVLGLTVAVLPDALSDDESPVVSVAVAVRTISRVACVGVDDDGEILVVGRAVVAGGVEELLLVPNSGQLVFIYVLHDGDVVKLAGGGMARGVARGRGPTHKGHGY